MGELEGGSKRIGRSTRSTAARRTQRIRFRWIPGRRPRRPARPAVVPGGPGRPRLGGMPPHWARGPLSRAETGPQGRTPGPSALQDLGVVPSRGTPSPPDGEAIRFSSPPVSCPVFWTELRVGSDSSSASLVRGGLAAELSSPPGAASGVSLPRGAARGAPERTRSRGRLKKSLPRRPCRRACTRTPDPPPKRRHRALSPPSRLHRDTESRRLWRNDHGGMILAE